MRNLALALLTAAIFLLTLAPAQGQRDLSGAAQIATQLERLNVLGSALMIAAHPDDENTALLAYLARGRKVRTAYLSATRGEGGQNLIGSEQGDLLGVIRTQELLSARRIDGAEQFFTRAIDFGFTKTAEETLEKWGRERILSDMVWTIRRYRPDVIILQFSGTPRDGHGQHQSSAILGKEAYAAAADKSRYPEQNIEPWQAKRIFSNPFGGLPQGAGGRMEVDTGDYNPVLGKSYTEIAGMSRSQHSSQGMGSQERRGAAKSAFSLVAGDPAATDLFDGVDTTWNRVPGGAAVAPILAEAVRTFSPEDPSKTIPLLLKVRPLIAKLAADGSYWPTLKLRDLDEAIAACAGLWLDIASDRATATPGTSIQATLTAINRSKFPLTWLDPEIALGYNQVQSRKLALPVAPDQAYSQPFWLAKPKTASSYTIDRQDLRDLPDNPPFYVAKFQIQAGSERIEIERPLQFRFVDPERGELVRPVAIVPAVAVNLPEAAFVFPNGKPQQVQTQVRANVAKAAGEIRLQVENGWKVTPASQSFNLADVGEQVDLMFTVTPATGGAGATLRATADVSGQKISAGMRVISYPHIPIEITFPAAEARAEQMKVTTLAKKVGYVMGAGDNVPKSLRQLGCDVTLLTAEDLGARNLAGFDAIVTGVRAYNVRPDLRANQNRLLNYVRDGGTLIVQYNVPDRGQRQSGALSHLGPYPLQVGGERVTVEEAPVKFPNPNHPLLNTPNKITERDFEGWIQERGLYFASQWDAKYQPVWESHDPGQQPQLGGTLYARHGKGVYIFSPYVWFRQLPAGVPGAYRIFANFLSAGKVAR